VWEKIKTVLSIAGAVLSVLFFTVLLFVLRRGKTDGRGSDGADERDSRIEEGLADSEEGAERIEDRIKSAEDAIASCEEHLQRAEDLLRGAVERSRKEKSES
jgi:F0F1-type ATP synthase membrane subunit b/b'